MNSLEEALRASLMTESKFCPSCGTGGGCEHTRPGDKPSVPAETGRNYDGDPHEIVTSYGWKRNPSHDGPTHDAYYHPARYGEMLHVTNEEDDDDPWSVQHYEKGQRGNPKDLWGSDAVHKHLKSLK